MSTAAIVSPSGDCLAVGSHDNYIYVYDIRISRGVEVSPVFRLSGHSSYVTHIDWSADARLLRSTCGINNHKFSSFYENKINCAH